MSEHQLTGGCNCGAVRFEVNEPLVYAYYCHCTRCQKRSGTAASPGAVAAPGSFSIVKGEDALRSWSAGDGFDKWFCAECGSHIHASHPENPQLVSIRMGAFDSDPGIRPSARHWVSSAVDWEQIPDDGLIKHSEGLPTS